MKNTPENIESVTLIISEMVQPQRIKEYEEWVTGINQAVKKFAGFIGVDVIRPRNPKHLEYVVIVRFNTYQNLTIWQESKICQIWLDKAKSMTVRQTHVMEANGLELWFTLPENIYPVSKQPVYYKRVAIGIIAVFPLVLLINMVLEPLLSRVPYILGIFFSVIAISMLMTYPVMPFLTHVLRSWLYPSADKNN